MKFACKALLAIAPLCLVVSANDDISYVRLAETTDGINFTDKGILEGLNNPMDVSRARAGLPRRARF